MQRESLLISTSREGLELARALQHELLDHADVTLLPEAVFQPGKTVFETLDDATRLVDAAAIILCEDDPTRSPRSRRPRDNQMLELGFLLAKLGRSRTFLVVPKYAQASVELPSDLSDTLHIQYSPEADSVRAMAPVAQRLRAALARIGTQSRADSYNCFVSYAVADRDFSVKLTRDLEELGISCWLDTKELLPGGPLADQIGRAVDASDKLVLVLSQASIGSKWVLREARHALDLERRRKTPFLIPLRLDDAIFSSSNPESAELLTRQIADFRNWRDEKSYKDAFSQLVRSLMVSRGVEKRGAR